MLQSREHLLSLSAGNRTNLNTIEDSLFVIALDDWARTHPSPHQSSRASELLPLPDKRSRKEPDASADLDGHILNSCAGRNGHNRWFDKTICVSVENNSRASVVGEHSSCDALIPGIIADYMLADGMGRPKGPPEKTLVARHSTGKDQDSEDAITLADLEIKRLEWLTDAKIVEDIQKAEKTVEEIVNDSEGLMLWYDEYGADWMKKQGKRHCPARKAHFDAANLTLRFQLSCRLTLTSRWPCSLPIAACTPKVLLRMRLLRPDYSYMAEQIQFGLSVKRVKHG
jgi:carnitine O-acetyltransferase